MLLDRVHRSFIHRHPGLNVAVAAAADSLATGPEPGAGVAAVGRRSLLADNANLREHARRLQQRITDLEACLSELLGAHAANCAGLGPLDTTDTKAELDQLRQTTCSRSSRKATRNSRPPAKPTGAS
jgi:hypothetical protein